MMAFASSFNHQKWFLVDTHDGSVVVWSRAQPPPCLQLAVPASTEGKPDGLLRWMEEYSKRLSDGYYAVATLIPESPGSLIGISLFPTSGAEVSRCVTRGVEVTASCIYMPEHVQGWTCSIITLLLLLLPLLGPQAQFLWV